MDYQVTHIIPDSNDPGRRIDAIYGPLCGLIYQDDAIRRILMGQTRFFIREWGIAAMVHVAEKGITKFLTTSPDGFGPNNLCQLPRFYG